jgi:thiamine biosynthesis lipoprotein
MEDTKRRAAANSGYAESGCDNARTSARYQASHHAMGTVFSIVTYGASSELLAGAVGRAFQEIDRLNDLMSHYKPDSELSVINRQAAHGSVTVTPELFRILEQCFRYSEETEGAFDITVGPLMKLWGFFQGAGHLPSVPALAEVRKQVGYRHVVLGSATRTVRFDRTGVELDLGAFGKGYAVDRVAAILSAEGITQALVSSGASTICAMGSPPGKQGWTVSLCDPFDRRRIATRLQIQNLSISVSGNYEKLFEAEGKIYTHILDPGSGMPAENMLMTAVISPSSAESDALSTSFFIKGIGRSRTYLDSHSELTALFFTPSHLSQRFEQKVFPARRPVRNSFVAMPQSADLISALGADSGSLQG